MILSGTSSLSTDEEGAIGNAYFDGLKFETGDAIRSMTFSASLETLSQDSYNSFVNLVFTSGGNIQGN
jgi:hypothetical protein